MTSSADQFDEAFLALSEDVASAVYMEQLLSAKTSTAKANSKALSKQSDLLCMEVQPRRPVDILKGVLEACNKKRRLLELQENTTPSDEDLSYLAKFTDKFKLFPYRNFLHFVPRLVNVVTARRLLTARQHAFGRLQIMLLICVYHL